MLPEFPAHSREQFQSEVLRENEYLPYTCTVVSEALMDYAAKYLNETEESRQNALREMRAMLKKDHDFTFHDDDNFLLVYLRSRKFDVQRSVDLFRRAADFADSNRLIIDRSDILNVVQKTIESNVLGFLPYRDKQGKALLYCRSEAWDPAILPADDIICGCIVALQSAMDNPVNQIAGFIVIIDFNNLKMAQVIAMVPWLVFGIQALQSCCPCLVKQFHVINTPSICKMGWKLIKPVLSKKIRSRISFHKSSNWTTLHNIVPPTLLPSELGGQLGPFNNKHWVQDCKFLVKQCYEKYNLNGFLSKKKKLVVP